MAKKFKRGFTRTTAVLFAALLLGTSAYVPQVAQVIDTGIVANAVTTTVENANGFIAAVANGGDIQLTADITIDQSVTINKACTIDFNEHTITFSGDEHFLTTAASTTLKNGTLTSSYTDDPRFSLLVVNADTVVERMTIKQPGNRGAHWMVSINQPKTFTMIDSTITYYGGTVTSGFHVNGNDATVQFYGNNTINASRISWITNGNVYLYPGTLQINGEPLYDYTKRVKVHFCGGTAIHTGGKTPFTGLSANQIVLDDGYALYSDEECTVPMTVQEALNATAIYSKLAPQTREVDFSGLGDATITLTDNKEVESTPVDGKGTIIEGGKVTSSVPLKFTGAEVTEAVDNDSYIYTINSITADTVTVAKGYVYKGTYWGLTEDGTLELFGTIPVQSNFGNLPWQSSNSEYNGGFSGRMVSSTVKKVVALPGTVAQGNLDNWFNNAYSIEEIDFSNLTLSNVTSLSKTFFYCQKLKTIRFGTKFDTSKVENMDSMFYYCSDLSSIEGIENFNTDSLTKANAIFNACYKLELLDLSSWNMQNVTNRQYTFNACNSLQSLKIGSSFGGIKADDFLPAAEDNLLAMGWYTENANVSVTQNGRYVIIEGVDSDTTFTRKYAVKVDDISAAVYTGSELTPEVTVTKKADSTKTLTKDTDYTVEYENNVNAGTATVKVYGIGEYGGTATKTFKIFNALDLSDVTDREVTVYDADGSQVTITDNIAKVDKGYTITSKAALSFDGAKVIEYEPDEDENPYPDLYTYEITKAPTKDSVKVTHGHTLSEQNDSSLLQVKCDTEVGAVYETVAELTVNGSGNYSYGEKIEIVTDNQGTDGIYEKNAVKYGNKGAVEFIGTPVFRNKSDETESWNTEVRTSIGEYTAQVGAKFLDVKYLLNKDFSIVKKNVGDLTAMIDLDGEGTAYNPTDSTALPTITYNGNTYTPTASLVYKNFWNGSTTSDKTLTADDYDVTVAPGTNAGTYTITFTGKGNYTGTKTVNWTIGNASMNLSDGRTNDEKSFVYNGTNTVNTAQFKVNGVPEGANVTYTYFSENGLQLSAAPTTVGNYKVKVAYTKANYNDGEITLPFEVKQRTVTITPTANQKITYGQDIPTQIAYTASNVVEGETINATGLVVVNGKGVLNAGTYNYILVNSVENNYPNYTFVLDETNKFTVEKKALTKDMFTVSPTSLTYNGKEQAVNVTASDEIILPADPLDPLTIPLITTNDWEIVDNSNKATDAGTYIVTVKATDNGNYTGTLALDNNNQKWNITAADIENNEQFTVTLDQDTFTYDAQSHTPNVTVKYNGATLDGNSYSLDIQSGTTVGTYNYTVTGKGNFSGTKTGTWSITPADIYMLKISSGTKTYDGKAVEDKDFRVTTKLLENQAKDSNANLSYVYTYYAEGSNQAIDAPTSAGKYTVKVTVSDAKGNYNAKETTASFEIKKRAVEIYPNEGQSAEYGTTKENITIRYDVEQAEEDSITGLVSGENKSMFDGALVISGEDILNVGYYDIVVNSDFNGAANYNIVYEYPVQFEITKKTITENMFGLQFVGSDSQSSNTEETFTGDKIAVQISTQLTSNDYTAAGTFSAYLPGEYTITIKGKGNYQGTVTKKWNLNAQKVNASTVVTTNGANNVHVYDGQTPVFSVLADDKYVLPANSQISYKYYQKNADNEWQEIANAPVNVGTYKVQGVVSAKGYSVTVKDAEFTIEAKKINITIADKDLNGTYGEESYTIPYTYDQSAIIDEGVTVTGDIVVNVGSANVGSGMSLDTSRVSINSENYELVFPSGKTFTLNAKELDDNNIVFDNDTAALHDIGSTSVNFRVVVNGKELVKGQDYEVAGTTEADSEGSYSVQITGIGNYTGFAEKTWTLRDDPDARAAAASVIEQNVTVALGENFTAKLSGGKKRITATVNGTAQDGYTITKAGFVYIPAADYNENNLVIGGEGVTNVVRNNASSYTYGMIDNAGTGIYVRGYVVANNGAYETVIYTDAVKLVYDELVEYTVTVVGGTIGSTNETTASYTGSAIKTDKPVVRVTAGAAPEGQQFYRWKKNGVVASYDSTYAFFMTEKDTTVEAEYVDKDDDVETETVLNFTAEKSTTSTGKNAVKFVFEHNIPDTYTVQEIGILYATNKQVGANTTIAGYALADLTADGSTYGVDDVEHIVKEQGANVKKYVAGYTNNNGKVTYAYGIGTNVDAYVYGVGYAVVTTEQGEEKTLYSDLVATTYNNCD